MLVNMSDYRDMHFDKTILDHIILCKGNARLWKADVPAGTKIQVRGSRVFALLKRKNRIMRQEIAIPRNLNKPIGKVSALADYE